MVGIANIKSFVYGDVSGLSTSDHLAINSHFLISVLVPIMGEQNLEKR